MPASPQHHLSLFAPSPSLRYILLLAEVIDELPNVRHLSVRNNRLTDVGVNAIVSAAVRKRRPLRSFNIAMNDIDEDASIALAHFLANRRCRLQHLYLGTADLDDFEIARLMKALESNALLRTLDISDNIIGGRQEHMLVGRVVKHDAEADDGPPNPSAEVAVGGRAIASMLEANSALVTLDLSWNRLGSKSGEAIGAALRANIALTSLNLAYNAVGDDGAKAIGAALEYNGALTSLSLAANGVENRGAAVLADGLHENSRLGRLELDGNPLGHDGTRSLLRALNFSVAGCDLSFRNCTFDTVDPKSGRFDPRDPRGWHLEQERLAEIEARTTGRHIPPSLDLSDPFERAVAKEMLRLATYRSGVWFERLRHFEHLREHRAPGRDVQLVRPPPSARGRVRARRHWSKVAEQQGRRDADAPPPSPLAVYTRLDASQARERYNEIALVEAANGEPWKMPRAGKLEVRMGYEPRPATSLSVRNATGFGELVRLCTEYPNERMRLLQLGCDDAYFCADQVQELLDTVGASNWPFHNQQLLDVLAYTLPRVVDREHCERLLDRNLSSDQVRALCARLNDAWPVVVDAPTGRYSLDLSQVGNRIAPRPRSLSSLTSARARRFSRAFFAATRDASHR